MLNPRLDMSELLNFCTQRKKLIKLDEIRQYHIDNIIKCQFLTTKLNSHNCLLPILKQNIQNTFPLRKMDWKVFKDLVHGHMTFHPLIVSIIDTPQIQRLRNLKQTGPSYLVYPTSVHSRFEHSLGTCFLAGKFMEALNRKRGLVDNSDELTKRKEEILCVQIAGLCHDMGHGPFSHLWENFLKRCNINWNHEKSSVEIFDVLLDEVVPDRKSAGREISIRELFGRYNIENYIPLIKKMIYDDSCGKDDHKDYLFQIVSNGHNDIDVDKWDYILRDSKMANVPISFDCGRIFEYSRILETPSGSHEICFRDKECSTLINMFLSRGVLHDRIYQHKKVRIIEEMIIDAFIASKERLNLTSTTPESLLKLTDHIYEKILYDDFGEDKNMLQAKTILQKLEKRRLYVCIAAQEIESVYVSEENVQKIEDKMYKCLKDEDEKLTRAAIRATLISIDMTKSNADKPLKNVMIYKKNEGEKCQPELFDWDIFQYSLKPDLRKLRRTEILIIYKGEDRLKYSENCNNIMLQKILKQYFNFNAVNGTSALES